MSEPATSTPKKQKRSFNWWALILWPGVLVLVYFLSLGPLMLMEDKGRHPFKIRWVFALYKPWGWVYQDTPLHKPLGMYLHLWSERYEKNGEPVAVRFDNILLY